MRPNAVLREEIKALIHANGAYIIVSSSGSTTDTALKNRVDAMKKAVADEANHENFHLDFFDRGRIATWVRSHPSLMLWVRNKIGRPLIGWRPYENWANAPGGVEEEYLLDDGLRLHDRTTTAGKGLSRRSRSTEAPIRFFYPRHIRAVGRVIRRRKNTPGAGSI